MDKTEWKRIFAEQFYDCFRTFEISTFGKPITPDSDLFQISYENAEASYEGAMQFSPVDAAESAFENLKK